MTAEPLKWSLPRLASAITPEQLFSLFEEDDVTLLDQSSLHSSPREGSPAGTSANTPPSGPSAPKRISFSPATKPIPMEALCLQSPTEKQLAEEAVVLSDKLAKSKGEVCKLERELDAVHGSWCQALEAREETATQLEDTERRLEVTQHALEQQTTINRQLTVELRSAHTKLAACVTILTQLRTARQEIERLQELNTSLITKLASAGLKANSCSSPGLSMQESPWHKVPTGIRYGGSTPGGSSCAVLMIESVTSMTSVPESENTSSRASSQVLTAPSNLTIRAPLPLGQSLASPCLTMSPVINRGPVDPVSHSLSDTPASGGSDTDSSGFYW